ncbi:hypothetical protein [Arthrobacter oryzae]|uniref:hypothetical protein n=1 Tax=Arthrobacter oryzae TaxID=409290 RepID=UPI00273C96D0|nr:hypothetical protein [Arthrobacter oryzae]WLQ05795.1 hypothetical protein Q8Z05_17025 [Arthrobacter oryzae]
MTDDDHPKGGGKPAYRLVHKTIRTVVAPSLSVDMDSLRLTFGNGAVTLGEPIFEGALSSRRPGHFLLPEWGSIEHEDGFFHYQYKPNVGIHVRAHQTDTPVGNYVEILYAIGESSDSSYEGMVAAGRAGVAPLLVMLDLMFGERMLGPLITEEVGEVFEDWHWNRMLGGRTVALESQARPSLLPAQEVWGQLEPKISAYLELDDVSRQRLKIAGQWYWLAESQADRVMGFISYWLVLESLELGENANIAPLRRRLAAILDVDEHLVKEPVGRLNGIRSGLVHGSVRSVDEKQLGRVRTLAAAVLRHHALGSLAEADIEQLRGALFQGPAHS